MPVQRKRTEDRQVSGIDNALESGDTVSSLVANLIPIAARRKAAARRPAIAGASYFYEVESGWAVKILEQDDDVFKARTPFDLEEAFQDEAVRSILIPCHSSITRIVAKRVCSRHGRGKTVFYEVGSDE